MSSRNRSRRTNDRHRLPPLNLEGQPAEPPDEQPTDDQNPEPEPTEQVDEAAAAETLSRRDRRRAAKSPAAPENTGGGGGRADAKPAVTRQPFRHRSR